jgi:hypothetical protein
VSMYWAWCSDDSADDYWLGARTTSSHAGVATQVEEAARGAPDGGGYLELPRQAEL